MQSVPYEVQQLVLSKMSIDRRVRFKVPPKKLVLPDIKLSKREPSGLYRTTKDWFTSRKSRNWPFYYNHWEFYATYRKLTCHAELHKMFHRRLKIAQKARLKQLDKWVHDHRNYSPEEIERIREKVLENIKEEQTRMPEWHVNDM